MSKINVNNLKSNISFEQFQELLNGTKFNLEQKEHIISIFNQVSGNDGELSVGEWRDFVKMVNTDGEKGLSDAELFDFIEYPKNIIPNFGFQEFKDFYQTVVEHIKNSIGKKENEVIYHPKTENTFRKKPDKTQGTFDDNWIEMDEYGSKTYEEWLYNNGYEFNSKVGADLQRRARRKDYMKDYCARAIRLSMQDTTAVSRKQFLELQNNYESEEPENEEIIFKSNKLFNNMNNQQYAYQYGSELAKNPYVREIPHNIVANMNLADLPKGCIILYDANYTTTIDDDGKINYHKRGHIGVTDGFGKDSGGVYQFIKDEKQETHLRIFIPIVVID